MKRLCVLLVEDTDDLRSTVAELLDELGFEPVVTAHDGVAALEILDSMSPPDLIITDLMMPRMTGWQFVARLRQRRDTARVPVIASSASPLQDGSQFTAFLPKPFSFEELRRVICMAIPGFQGDDARSGTG